MATTNPSQHDSFTDGMSKFAEATRHSMTASRLAAAGTMALGAATFFYLADAERREAVMQQATRMFENLTSWWQRPSASEGTDAGDGGASPGAPTGVA